MSENTNFEIVFAAPALPLPPAEYSQQYFDSINSVLRLYFNQLDQALRSTAIVDQAEASSWFIS